MTYIVACVAAQGKFEAGIGREGTGEGGRERMNHLLNLNAKSLLDRLNGHSPIKIIE
jgi:hypothetical protein